MDSMCHYLNLLRVLRAHLHHKMTSLSTASMCHGSTRRKLAITSLAEESYRIWIRIAMSAVSMYTEAVSVLMNSYGNRLFNMEAGPI